MSMRKTAPKPRHAARGRLNRVPEATEVLGYLEQAGGAATEHELARAFGVKRRDRFRLKRVLRELEDGDAPRSRRRRSGAPPSVAVLDVAALDADGEPLARLASEPEDTPPRIRLRPGEAEPTMVSRPATRSTASRNRG